MSKKIFNENEYNSNDGMLTSIWGPPLWHSLHVMSFNYPVKPNKEIKKHYLEFFTNLKYILPCKYCRDNYIINLKNNPITPKVLKNRESFSRWLYEMHEIINSNLNKKSGLTYDDVRDRYEHFRSRCLNNPVEDTKIEKGCTESLYGIKSKCILNIVPTASNKITFNIDKKCNIIKK